MKTGKRIEGENAEDKEKSIREKDNVKEKE